MMSVTMLHVLIAYANEWSHVHPWTMGLGLKSTFESDFHHTSAQRNFSINGEVLQRLQPETPPKGQGRVLVLHGQQSDDHLRAVAVECAHDISNRMHASEQQRPAA